MSKKFGRLVQLAGAMVAVACLGAGAAQARTFPASSGKTVDPTKNGCFSMWYSSMTNVCAAQTSFELPLVVDSAGNKTVDVYAYGAGPANNVGCQAVGMNKEVTWVWASPRVYLAAFGASQQIRLTGAYVPASGYLYANCLVNNGGRINSVDLLNP